MGFIVQIDIERCKGCGLCVEECPRDLLVMSKSLSPAGAHIVTTRSREGCTGCLHCAIICPDAAIEIEHD